MKLVIKKNKMLLWTMFEYLYRIFLLRINYSFMESNFKVTSFININIFNIQQNKLYNNR